MKFIHAADLHLDSPFEGLKSAPPEVWQAIYQSTFTAFEKLITTALTESVDFILLVGDLFDRAEQSIQVQAFLKKQFVRLEEAEIPVYLSYGNHDYQNKAQTQLTYGENVHVMQEKVTTFTQEIAGEQYQISGFSYHQRWVEENRVADFPSKGTEEYHIGMIHGSLSTMKSAHAVYAPFRLEDLLRKNYDYWALGHIHQRQVLNDQPPIIYPGNLQGRHKNETGAKGFYLVTQKNGLFAPQFVVSDVIEWQTEVITLTKSVSLEEVVALIQDIQMRLLTEKQKNILLQITLRGLELLDGPTLKRYDNGEILDLLQAETKIRSATYFCWPYQLKGEFSFPEKQLVQLDAQAWQLAQEKIFSDDLFAQKMAPLYEQPILNHLLNELDFKAEVQKEVRDLLAQVELVEEHHEN